MHKHLTIYPLLFMLLVALQLQAYGQPIKPPEWQVSLTTIVARDTLTPFWLHANQRGLFGLHGNTNAINLNIQAPVPDPQAENRFHISYGLQLFGRTGSSSDLWLQEGYLGASWRNVLRVQAGLWNDITGSMVPEISSGSIIWSGNARPLPRIEAGTPGYVPVPYTNGRVEIKGLIAHGWFIEDRFVADVLLHHKNAFVRIGGDFSVNIWYGLNHYAKWGGSSPNYDKPFPVDLDSYYRVFFIRSGQEDDPATPGTWANHKFGDHLGSRNHGIDVHLNGFSAGVFLQDVMEDGSGWRRQNFPDGLWAGWVRFHESEIPIRAITYEYLQTTDQSGPRHNDEDGNIIGGNDNYFNHAIYQSGWSYHGHTIGTPLITSPLLNDPPFHRFTNNRVRAHHLGVKGDLTQNITYRNKITWSRNYGTHSNPFDRARDQWSWMLELRHTKGFLGLEAGLTLAVDRGAMYGDQMGVMVQLLRRGGF